MKSINLLLIYLLLLPSCAVLSPKLQEPSSLNDKLIIGKINLNAKNYKMYGGNASVNGKHSNNIKLTFKNHTTGKEFTVTSKGKYGLFYFLGDQETDYELTKVYFKTTEMDDSWADVWHEPWGLIHISSKDGVYNIGSLDWDSEKTNEYNKNELTQAELPSNTKKILESEYPDSLWLNKEWYDTNYIKGLDAYSKLISWYPSNPEYASVFNEFAWTYVTDNEKKTINSDQALSSAFNAVKLTKRDNSSYLDTLAAVYAKNGQFDKAIEVQEEAIINASRKGEKNKAEKFRQVLSDYQQRKIHY